MSRQSWVELAKVLQADGAAIGNTTTETSIMPGQTIPAEYMEHARAIRLTMRGRISNVVTAAPTMTWRVRWGGVGGTVLCATAAVAASATAFTNAMWEMFVEIVVRANGAAGSLMAMGSVNTANAGAGNPQFMGSAGATAPAAVAIDLTADAVISTTFQWGTANASNTLTGHQFLLESLN